MGIVIASGILAVLVSLAGERVIRRHHREPLSRCPFCAADAVSAVERATVEETKAALELRCGVCGTWRRMVTATGAAELLELRIERQCRLIANVADRLEC